MKVAQRRHLARLIDCPIALSRDSLDNQPRGDDQRAPSQVNSGVTITYTQDLAAPLPVVLQSQTDTDMMQYVYALGTRPLAQYGDTWDYLLADALGSVRQIVDGSGNVTLAESYEPYGSLLSSTGTASSIFGYSGEQIDTYIKLLFLLARYYSPETARFLSKDVWQGNYTRPQSLHAWMYVEGDPINFNDPTGWCRGKPFDGVFGLDICIVWAMQLSTQYAIEVDPGRRPPGPCEPDWDQFARGAAITWEYEELIRLEDGLALIRSFLDSTNHAFIGTIGDAGAVVRRVHYPTQTANDKVTTYPNGLMEVTDAQFPQGTIERDWFWQVHNFMHELFHIYNYRVQIDPYIAGSHPSDVFPYPLPPNPNDPCGPQQLDAEELTRTFLRVLRLMLENG